MTSIFYIDYKSAYWRSMRLKLAVLFLFVCSYNIAKSNSLYVSIDKEAVQDSIAKDTTLHSKNLINKVMDYLSKTNEENEEKRFDFSIIGGPHYSSSIKLGVGIVGSGLFRIDPSDKSVSPSNVSVVADVATSGFYMLGLRGNLLFPHENYRIDMAAGFSSFPSKFWGIGYDAGRNDYYSKYTLQEIRLRFDLLKKIAPNTFLGIITNFSYTDAIKFKDKSLLNGESRRFTASGGGLILSYDSRDFIPNPRKGFYAKLEQQFYPEFLGSSDYFSRTEFIARFYKTIWEGGILAFDLQGTFNSSNVPWTMNAMIGGSYQMRGYFEGRYNDKKLIQTQVELRQHIYGRSGAVAWVGAGNVFPKISEFDWGHTLPTFGIGYRWEFKKRVNVRLDYGFGKGESAFYFNINEAF